MCNRIGEIAFAVSPHAVAGELRRREVKMKIHKERIAGLRREMAKEGIDYYLITTADYHHSEYVADFFCVREYFCGFTGSNGDLVIGKDFAGLWTDGRYWIQAAGELEESGVSLFKMGESGVPTREEYLADVMESGDVLGFDGRCVTVREEEALLQHFKKKSKSVILRRDAFLADRLWKVPERPSLPCHPIFVLPPENAGKSFGEKLSELRSAMKAEGAAYYITGKLDDLMWLTNLRGGDIPCNPVALAYGFFSQEEAVLFLQGKEVTEQVQAYAREMGLLLKEYDEFSNYLGAYVYQGAVLYDPADTGCNVREILLEKGAALKEGKSPLALPKAIKNETEIRNLKEAYRQDSGAVCRFLYWLTKEMEKGRENLTEVDAAAYLDGLRAQLPGYLELSFDTISAYGANAAMMHYTATREHCAKLRPEGMLLVDSGGQYMTGTTDVTRTTALGPVTEEMKRSYTLTAVGNLALLNAVFMKGCSGINLDILCREPLWSRGIDYKCGTGHGIGYILNVHEGPHAIRWRAMKNNQDQPILPGMIVSDEPGVYVEGEYGIRIETILLCTERMENGDGTFYGFEPLTFVPLDRNLLDPQYMNETDKKRLNTYHAMVYEKVAPLLEEQERSWLKLQTAPME